METPCTLHKEHLPGPVQIAESEETYELKAVLSQAAVADFPMIPLALEHLKRVLDERANAGSLMVAFLL